MRRSSKFVQASSVLLLILGEACADDDLPAGPCNEDGGTSFVDGSAALSDDTFEVLPGGVPEPVDELVPPVHQLDHWYEAPGLYGLYREATDEELRRFQWPEGALLVAAPLGVLGEEGRVVSISSPTWVRDKRDWARDEQGAVVFHNQHLQKIQDLALGNFVEHHTGPRDSAVEIRRPIFSLYGLEEPTSGVRGQLLTESGHAYVLRQQTLLGAVESRAPVDQRRLDIAPPRGCQVAVTSPTDGGVTRPPLTSFDCENGECEEPDDPRDECKDGVDNDGDGELDLCDWNCLPHSDFGAHYFPEAQSRVENGKTYALMGGGLLCTGLGEAWMVTFADWALQASELLNDIRPEHSDPTHYRTFSCWVFEDQEAANGCQHGYLYEDGVIVDVGPPVCPPGMEDYPYQTQPGDPFPGLLFYDEATYGAWRDYEMSMIALGSYGEPVNGVGFLTNDALQTCTGMPCMHVAGLASLAPDSKVWELGRFVVTNLNPYDWITLAHETAHTMGLVHDDAVNGFMNPHGTLPSLGVSNDPKFPDRNNNAIWEVARESKHSHPRSSGWSWTGCFEVEDVCAPLGKPGWTCKEAWCEPE